MRNLCDNAGHTGDTYAYSGNRKRDHDCGERYRDKLFGERDSSSAENPRTARKPDGRAEGDVLGGGEGHCAVELPVAEESNHHVRRRAAMCSRRIKGRISRRQAPLGT